MAPYNPEIEKHDGRVFSTPERKKVVGLIPGQNGPCVELACFPHVCVIFLYH